MLDIKYIRENVNTVKKAVVNKQLEGTVDINSLLELDKKYSNLLKKVELHRSLRNELTNDISKLKGNSKNKRIKEASLVKEELIAMERDLKLIKNEFDLLMLWVPNIPANDVPIGENERGNVILRVEGKLPEFSFEPKTHLDLGKDLDIIDTERGTKLGGFRGYFLKNEGVELEQAILRYAANVMKKAGFIYFSVPWMVKPDFFTATGYFPWGLEDHYMVQDNLALIGTAEVSLTSYYADETLEEGDLPVKMVGISPCFRREVGSYGKDTRGIFRVHQFNKVEQVVLLPAGEDLSREWHDKMLGYSEEVLKDLKLPYHVLLMCTGDMGAGQRKKYDIETWFPAQKKYRETHSDSYFLDFQARRLNMKYKTKTGEIKYVNTINNTVAATPRLMAAIIENYQQEDGSILVPEVLREYTGFKVIRKK